MIIMIKTKSDFGPDEFKVIREIILAHPRLQKKKKDRSNGLCYCSISYGAFCTRNFFRPFYFRLFY